MIRDAFASVTQKKNTKNLFFNNLSYLCVINFKQNNNMKKIILSVVAVMAFGFANAQDKKEGGAGLASGDLVLTGMFNYENTKQADAKGSELNIMPGVGYMLSDNLMLAGSIGFGSSTENDGTPGADDVKSSSIGLNVGVNYFWTPADRFSLSVGGSLGYGSETQKEALPNGDDLKTSTISLNVPVGLHYFVSDNFAITTQWGGLGYSSEKADFDGAEAKNTIGLGLDMSSISFGLIYKL
jgi:outer membrane protein